MPEYTKTSSLSGRTMVCGCKALISICLSMLRDAIQ